MNPIPVAGSSSGSSSGLEDVAAQRGSEFSVQEIDALRASVVAKYGNREKAQAFPRTEFVKAIARAANGYGANALHGGEIQIFADLLLKASGGQRPAADNESIEHLLEGFDNMIANSDDYNAGYLKAMRKEFAAFVTDWQTPAAKWLRQKAEAAKPAAEKTGWANPAHSLPGTLLRLADELDADRESAPFGLEPWEVPGADRSEPVAPLQIVAYGVPNSRTREMTDAELDELNRRELEAQAIERGDSPPLELQSVAPSESHRSTRNTQSSERAMLEAARAWIGSSPHGDNCFLHDDGGEYDACFCGKDSIENEIDSVLAAQPCDTSQGLSPRDTQWISVAESLPPVGTWCNVLFDRNEGDYFDRLNRPRFDVYGAMLREIDSEGYATWERWRMPDGGPISALYLVTHWMPLPPPPQSDFRGLKTGEGPTAHAATEVKSEAP